MQSSSLNLYLQASGDQDIPVPYTIVFADSGWTNLTQNWNFVVSLQPLRRPISLKQVSDFQSRRLTTGLSGRFLLLSDSAHSLGTRSETFEADRRGPSVLKPIPLCL